MLLPDAEPTRAITSTPHLFDNSRMHPPIFTIKYMHTMIQDCTQKLNYSDAV